MTLREMLVAAMLENLTWSRSATSAANSSARARRYAALALSRRSVMGLRLARAFQDDAIPAG